tara:strand:- start:2074 stop:3939 length:1866 start_codon:yes stop_codon:yes gene_type:complete
MCGFFTVISENNISSKNKKIYRSIANKINHRGPDDNYFYDDNNYLSIFYRLSIRDPSLKSRQPLVSKCGRYIISFNGEIYNLEELIPDIYEKNISDTTYLLELISFKGIDILNKIRGMFAISIYDKRECKVFITRDPLGIKPLFYIQPKFLKGTQYENSYFVCSEQNPLLNIINGGSLDKKHSLRFLKMGVCFDASQTFFTEIKQVKPGNIMEIDMASLEVKNYSLNSSIEKIDLERCSKFKKNDHQKFLYKTIKEHLISDFPISTTISSGIDSSCITTTAISFDDRFISPFTLESDLFNSEIKESSDLNNIKNMNIKTIFCEIENYSKSIENIISKISIPFASASWIFQEYLFNYLGKNKGFKVVLVGEGSDEIYSGYKRLIFPYLFCMEKDGEIDKVDLSLEELTTFMGKSIDELRNMFKNFKDKLTQETDYEDIKFEEFFIDTDNLVEMERYYPKLQSLDQNINTELFYKSHLIKYLKRTDIPSSLHILDGISMMNSIELRVPFLDISLIENIMGYSYKNHFKEGFNKFMLRSVCDEVPSSIRNEKMKKPRPSSTAKIMYEVLNQEFINIVKKGHPFINNSLIINKYNKAKETYDLSTSDLWFRIYTFLKFVEIYFGS